MRAVVAMSGGVDSSVAAVILRDEGHQVIGVTLKFDGSWGGDTIDSARRVAEKLGIPHHVFDLRDVFRKQVIDYFCAEYARGRTPNPCIRCNRHVKFGALMAKARDLGADFLATGHYARVEPAEEGKRYLLRRGVDFTKDQSYVLYSLTQEQLSYVRWPLGSLTKQEVRQMARDMGITVGESAESQEICFIPGDDYTRYFQENIPGIARPGPIRDNAGKVLGEHQGLPFYTIGQRKRLDIYAREPLYVIDIDAGENVITVGGEVELLSSGLRASGLNWLAVGELRKPIVVRARIRYRHEPDAATVIPEGDDAVYVRFAAPQRAITPGQAVVFYDGDVVVGGGTIESAVR